MLIKGQHYALSTPVKFRAVYSGQDAGAAYPNLLYFVTEEGLVYYKDVAVPKRQRCCATVQLAALRDSATWRLLRLPELVWSLTEKGYYSRIGVHRKDSSVAVLPRRIPIHYHILDDNGDLRNNGDRHCYANVTDFLYFRSQLVFLSTNNFLYYFSFKGRLCVQCPD